MVGVGGDDVGDGGCAGDVGGGNFDGDLDPDL